jgi:hypothetical protein
VPSSTVTCHLPKPCSPSTRCPTHSPDAERPSSFYLPTNGLGKLDHYVFLHCGHTHPLSLMRRHVGLRPSKKPNDVTGPVRQKVVATITVTAPAKTTVRSSVRHRSFMPVPKRGGQRLQQSPRLRRISAPGIGQVRPSPALLQCRKPILCQGRHALAYQL